MSTASQISSAFLNDLNQIAAEIEYPNLGSRFLQDLDFAYLHARQLAPGHTEVALSDLAWLDATLTEWRQRSQQLLQQYLSGLPADDPLREPVSLFATIDYGRLETAHTRALAWLLSDREHGFGFELLDALLECISRRQLPVVRADVRSEFPVSCGTAVNETGRLDVLIDYEWRDESQAQVSGCVVIEAKIDAEESDEHLSFYDDRIERNRADREVFRLFLTPDGREPESHSAHWEGISFLDQASVFRRKFPNVSGRPGYHYLRYYLAGVLRDVCRLPVPISAHCADPYTAIDYLKSTLKGSDGEKRNGHDR